MILDSYADHVRIHDHLIHTYIHTYIEPIFSAALLNSCHLSHNNNNYTTTNNKNTSCWGGMVEAEIWVIRIDAFNWNNEWEHCSSFCCCDSHRRRFVIARISSSHHSCTSQHRRLTTSSITYTSHISYNASTHCIRETALTCLYWYWFTYSGMQSAFVALSHYSINLFEINNRVIRSWWEIGKNGLLFSSAVWY